MSAKEKTLILQKKTYTIVRGKLLEQQNHNIRPTVVRDLINDISNTISACQPNDYRAITTILKKNFIYSPVSERWQRLEFHPRRNKCIDYLLQSWRTRPVIEALFFEHHRALNDLIKQFSNSDHANNLYHGLDESLDGTDITKTDLFSYNKSMRLDLSTHLRSLREYGIKLSNEGVSKGKQIGDIANDISNKITELEQYISNANQQTHAQALNILTLKLDILDILHRHDKTLQKHRGYGSLVGNIFTTLFTAGIANLINKATTGDWLFFKTTTATHISKIHDVLGIDQKHQIKFTQ